MAVSKSKHPFSRSEIVGLCKRFLKDGLYQASRDPILFYKIYSYFPDKAFWRHYDLGFKLNSLLFFLSKEGREKIETDLAVFNLDLSSKDKDVILEDKKIGEDVKITKKKETIADLFK